MQEAARPVPSVHLTAFNVMIVDDSVDAADTLALLIREFGHDVRAVYDGPSALSLAETFPPRVAFLDIGLPNMNGYELATRMRKQCNGAPMHLVALTGYGQKGDIARALASGFDEHMTKPMDFDRLELMLSRLPPC